MEYKTKVVNFFGGPGCSKSITTADVYSKIRWNGINAEIALEYAKELVFAKDLGKLQNQVYITGQQLQRLIRLNGQVEIIVCDSPVLLSTFYDKNKSVPLRELCLEQFNKFDNINYFINRDESMFEETGRLHDLIESKKKDKQIKAFLDTFEIPYTEIKAGPASCFTVAEHITSIVNKERKEYEDKNN